jgi:hypothetical protein
MFLSRTAASLSMLAVLFGSFALNGPAWAKGPKLESNGAFIQIAGAHWLSQEQVGAQGNLNVPLDTPTYVPIRVLLRAQDEISVDNILAKLADRQAAKDLKWDDHADHWQLNHDHGRSSVPLNDPISVVKGPQGFVVTDGHHDLFLALYVGAKSISIVVKEDLSALSALKFWEVLKSRRLSLMTASPEALSIAPPKMEDIRDNPNRYLASLLALKVKAKLKKGSAEIGNVKGTPDAVWIKVNDSVPFVEFYIATALSEAGIHYESSWGKSVPADIIEKARKTILIASKSGLHPELESIPVLEDLPAAAEAFKGKHFLKDILEQQLMEAAVGSCAGVFGI